MRGGGRVLTAYLQYTLALNPLLTPYLQYTLALNPLLTTYLLDTLALNPLLTAYLLDTLALNPLLTAYLLNTLALNPLLTAYLKDTLAVHLDDPLHSNTQRQLVRLVVAEYPHAASRRPLRGLDDPLRRSVQADPSEERAF